MTSPNSRSYDFDQKNFSLINTGKSPVYNIYIPCKIIIYPPIFFFTDNGKLFVSAADAEQANFLNFYSNLKKCSPDV